MQGKSHLKAKRRSLGFILSALVLLSIVCTNQAFATFGVYGGGPKCGSYADAQVMSLAAYKTLLESQGIPAQDLPGVQSVLVGRTGNLLHSSPDNIGYWTDYYFEDGDDMKWWGPIQGPR
jgi:hypothetical protein